VDIVINKHQFNLMNIYGPNEDDPQFIRTLKSQMEMMPHSSFVIGGDFNVVQEFTLDTRNIQSMNYPKAHDIVEAMKTDLDLFGPWRESNPNAHLFTWHARNKQSRIDYWLTFNDVMDLIDGSTILPGYRSDHSLIKLDLKLTNHEKGPGHWKFNNYYLLRDREYVNQVKYCIPKRLYVCQHSRIPFDSYDDLNLLQVVLYIKSRFAMHGGR
jgi:hypothetical protein